MMEITIYELLGLIKDGKAPKKIKYDNRYYIFNEKKDNYYENETYSINWDYVSLHCLNEKVEIFEEEKKIPEKLTDILRVDDLVPPVNENMYKMWTQTIENHNKINEICDYLKSKGE